MSPFPAPRGDPSPLPTHRVPDRGAGGPALELTARPSLGEVRRWTTAVLPPLHPDLLDDVLLVVNELVANAYDHTRDPVRLHVLTSDDHVRIEVEDGSCAPPERRDPDPGSTRGRGLLLIGNLAAAWGSTPREPGKAVWADLERSPAE